MKKLLFLSLLLLATPLFAQRRIDLFFDLEGVRTSGATEGFSPGTRFVPRFDTGGGIGGGVNWFLSDRVSIETKVAAASADMQLRIIGTDSIVNVSLGRAQLYPVSAMLQWHLAERRALRPYIGAGVVHTMLRSINKDIPFSAATGIEFKNPTGLVVGTGLEIAFGKLWSVYGDARYVPMETESRAVFVGTTSATTFKTRPLIVSAGISYRLRR